MSDRLSPCPFCGGEPQQEAESNGSRTFWIICDNVKIGCGCEGPYQPSPEDAAKAWNRRAPAPPQHLGVAERLKAYIKHARENVDLMKSKTVRPDVVELASGMCDDLEELVLSPSPSTREVGP